MKKRCKKAGAMLVTLALCAGMIPSAFAANEPAEQGSSNTDVTEGLSVYAGESVENYLYYNAGPENTSLTGAAQWTNVVLNMSSTAATIYPGAVVEYDLTLDNKDFTRFYTEAKFEWSGFQNKTFTPDELTENSDGTYTIHIRTEYEKLYTGSSDPLQNVDDLRLQFQYSSTYNYVGDVVITNIKVTNGQAPAQTVEAVSINNDAAYDDGSMGWTAEISGTEGEAVTITNPSWIITNSDNKTAAIENASAGDTKISTEGTVVFGLVLTANAIGENTITKVEFSY